MKKYSIKYSVRWSYAVVILLMLCHTTQVWGQVERTTAFPITIGTTPEFENTAYFQTGYNAIRPASFVYIEVDDDNPTTYEYKYTLDVIIKPLVPSGGVFVEEGVTPIVTSLVVEYNPFSGAASFNDLARYQINNRHGIAVEITGITLENLSDTSVPPSTSTPLGLELRLGFVADQEVIPLADTIPSPTAALSNGNTAITVNWNAIAGAVNYELEWAWYDSYSSDFVQALAAEEIPLSVQNFEGNHTRIQTENTFYEIPHIYEKGYLIYRIRAVGVFPENPSVPYHGEWSFNDATARKVSDWPGVLTLSTSHENDKNWQFQASYAEDGKKKEVVSYFDGTLRNRQTVTRINSDDNAIVGEVIYDNQGRPAIEVLPVPTDSDQIRYYEDFNRSQSTGAIYNHNDFDWDATTPDGEDCEVEVVGMSTVEGASKYYGPTIVAPGDDKPFQAYVPDAKNFPFSQIEYTPDNTGRVRRKSGVGPDHQLGSDHEMKYFYFTPTQEELNRLFGYRVGNASHYKKNMVVDPNGQVSVSYIDPQGRTIATALSGESRPSSGLEPLDGSEEILGVTTDLLNKLNPDATDTTIDANERYSTGRYGNLEDALRLTREIGVVKESPYTFNYNITNADFEIVCQGKTTSDTHTFPFKYDLVLTVTDDCGVVKIFDNPSANQINALVTDLAANDTGSLRTGNYTVYKDLRVNEETTEAYADQYVTLLQDEDSACYVAPFELDLPDTCNIDCVECLDGLGDKFPYIVTNLNLYFDLGFTTSNLSEDADGNIDVNYTGGTPQEQIQVDAYANGYATEWQLTLEACNSECGLQIITDCEVYNTLLLQDVSPGGQYGTLNTATTVMDNLSVFNDSETNRLRQGPNDYEDNNWRYPLTPYTNTDGTEARVILTLIEDNSANAGVENVYEPQIEEGAEVEVLEGSTQDGAPYSYILPQYLLHLQDFLDIWESKWAESLLGYHPEFKYLEYQQALCNVTRDVDVVYEENGVSVNTVLTPGSYDDYLRLINTYEHAVDAGLTAADVIMDEDPYFQNVTGLSPTRIAIMDLGLNENYEGSGEPLLRVAYAAAVCNGLTDCNLPTTTINLNNLSGLTTQQKDRVWQQYKNHYLGLKGKIQYVLLNAQASASGYYNGCMLGQNPDGTGGVTLRTPDDVINLSTLELYLNPNTNINFTVPSTNQICDTDATLYATKQKRFIPIDATIDIDTTTSNSTLTGLIEDAQTNADAITYLETGKCPNLLDLELFLNGFITQEGITDLVGSNEYTGQYLTSTLYNRFVGQGDPDAIVFTGEINATDSGLLNFELDGSNAALCANPLTLKLPDNNWNNALHGWDDYGSSWQITGFSSIYFNGFIDGENTFSILGQIQIGTQLLDAVFTGTTCVPLGNCEGALDLANVTGYANGYSLVAPCTLEEDIATDYAGLLNALIDSGHIFDTTAYDLGEEISYTTGILPVYYDDNIGDVDAIWTFDNGDYVISLPRPIIATDGNTDFEIVPRLTMHASTLESIVNNSNFERITSIAFDTTDDYSQSATISYLNANGTTGTTVVTFEEIFDFACCPREEDVVIDGDDPNDPITPYEDNCHFNGEGLNHQEVNFQSAYLGMLNYMLSVNADINNASVNVSGQITNPNEPFWWETNFEGICDALCYDTYEFNSNATMRLDMVAANLINSSLYPPGTIGLYFGGSFSKGLILLETTITDFTTIANFVKFDVDANKVELVYDTTTGGRVTLQNLEFNMYAGCDLTNTQEIFENTGADFCTFTLPPAPTCDTGPGGGGQRTVENIIIDPIGPMGDSGEIACGTCIAQPVIPISCTQGYQAYLDFMDFEDTVYTDDAASQTIEGVTFSTFYQENFCNLNFQYLVASYSYYIETLGVTDINNPNYLSLAQFGNTDLRYGYNGINEVIDAYATYYVNHSNDPSFVSWSGFVNTIYLRQHAICPPATLIGYYPVQLVDDCEDFLSGIKETYEAEAYQELLAELRESFVIDYLEEAISDAVETLDMTYTDEEYQYTLYYYDQAGNLAQTVPPQGVDRFDILDDDLHTTIDAFRAGASPTSGQALEHPDYVPDHNLETQYRYNSLNQLVWQQTPDGGITRFAYDDLGRIIASQDAGQGSSNATLALVHSNVTSYAVSTDNRTITKQVNAWEKAVSEQFLIGDGFLERTLDIDSNRNRAVSFGLSYATTDLGNAAAHTAMAYTFYTYTGSNGVNYIVPYNHGASLGSITYQAGDVLKIERILGEVKYYRNGDLLHTVTETQPGAPLQMDINVAYTNSVAADIKFEGYTTGNIISNALSLRGRSISDYQISSDSRTIRKLNDGWKKELSTQFLEGNGYLARTLDADINKNRAVAFGLSYADTHLDAAAPHRAAAYSFYTYTGSNGVNNIIRYANGNTLGSSVYVAGDQLKIERSNGQVKYYQNSTLLQTIAETQPGEPLRIDANMYYTDAEAAQIEFIGYDTGAIITAVSNEIETLTLTGPYVSSYNVSSDGDEITKLDSGWKKAVSQEFMQGNGYLERTLNPDSNKNWSVSFGLDYANADYPNIHPAYAMAYTFYTYTTATGNYVRWHVNGATVGSTSYQANDVLKIERHNGEVHFYINDVLQDTITELQAGEPLQIATNISNINAKVEHINFVDYALSNGANANGDHFSYTTYDGIGRVTEAGEIRPAGSYNITPQGRLEQQSGNEPVQVNGFDFVGATRNEVTQTVYDRVVPIPIAAATDPITHSGLLFESDNAPLSLRNRVSGVLYYDMISDFADRPAFTNAMFYNYDIHGNVKELVHYYADLYESGSNKHLKRVAYDYDLISGNVERVTYQKEKADQFIHKYSYDADNRITAVQTSRDGYIWEEDGTYQYYDHGPLARMEIGDKKVQGSDYIYTIQGWLKSVNGEYIEDATNDFGKDGTASSTVARDAFGYSLGYYNGDYTAVGTNVITTDHFSLSNPTVNTLYNGNINQMVTSLRELENTMLPAQVNRYTYDQLNRIKSMNSDAVIGNGTTTSESYASTYSYDRNGNLNTLTRKALNNGVLMDMDNFNYQYLPNTNKLTLVNDTVSEGFFDEDLDDQEISIGIPYTPENIASHNYEYDGEGQLIKDKTELLTIEWRVDGKVDRVFKYEDDTFSTVIQTTIFGYDGLGDRIAKTVVPQSGNVVTIRYARDAKGNVLGVFETVATLAEYENQTYGSITHKEHHIYGSNRLGIANTTIDLEEESFSGFTSGSEVVLGLGDYRSTQWTTSDTALQEERFGVVNFQQTLEFNLLDAVPVNDSIKVSSIAFSRSDRSATLNKNTLEVYYKNEAGSYYPVYIINAETAGGTKVTHYITSAFGFTEADALNISSINTFNADLRPGKEAVSLKINNTVLSLANNFLRIDTSTTTAAATVEEVPISVLGGNYDTRFQLRQLEYQIRTEENTIQDSFIFNNPNTGLISQSPGISGTNTMEAFIGAPIWEASLFNNAIVSYAFDREIGDKNYELSNHLRNVLSVVTDKKIPTFTGGSLVHFNADILAYNDYYPFGMLMPDRHANTADYRYGFQGQELDNEIKGEGNSLNYKYRMHDPRVGRFFAVDPLTARYPFLTPYQFSGNRVMDKVELEGLEPSDTPQEGECENCNIEELKDGDFFSDVQTQKYTVTFEKIDQETFDNFKHQMGEDPGKIVNNTLASYRLVDRDGSYGVTEDDHFDIDIYGPDNGYVVVGIVNETDTSLSVTVHTLEGHTDAGTNTFSVSYDPEKGLLTWTTNNISRSNDFATQGILSGLGARAAQQKQWKNVMVKVYDFLGKPEVRSAEAIVKEYDYSDRTNTIGAEEKDESFIEDLKYLFKKSYD